MDRWTIHMDGEGHAAPTYGLCITRNRKNPRDPSIGTLADRRANVSPPTFVVPRLLTVTPESPQFVAARSPEASGVTVTAGSLVRTW